MTQTVISNKLTKPVLLKKAQLLQRRSDNQEKATITLFYVSALAISSALIF